MVEIGLKYIKSLRVNQEKGQKICEVEKRSGETEMSTSEIKWLNQQILTIMATLDS
jgi:hypothetical protein